MTSSVIKKAEHVEKAVLMSRLCTGITLVLTLLITFSFITVASATMNDEYIMEISIDENHVSFADHNGTAEGNWISLSGGEAFNVPEPFTFTYNGINSKNALIKGRNVTVELNVENNTDHVITYPYDTHQMYVAGSGLDDVSFTFHGSDHFANREVDVYLFNSSIVDLKHVLDDLMEGNTASAHAIYDNSQVSEDVLDGNGDMSMTYTDMNPGSYSIVIIHTDDMTEENILLSATAFEVLDYTADLETTRNSNNVQLDISIEDAPDETYTYGAILIKESAYTTDVRVEFDGTQDGFDVLMNGMPIIEGFDLVGMSKDDIDGAELEECLTDIFGADNISIVYEAVYGTNATLYADTTGLSEGDYLIFAGVTSDHDMVAFEQDVMYITSVGMDLSGDPGDEIFINDTKNGIRVTIGLNQSLTNGMLQIEKQTTLPNNLTQTLFDTPAGFVTFTPNDNLSEAMSYAYIYLDCERSAMNGTDENAMRIYWYDETNSTWVPLEGPGHPSCCLEIGQYMTEDICCCWVKVTHFSTYAIGGPVYHPYDANEDGMINLDEVNTAIDDYRTGQTDLETINEVIDLYRIGAFTIYHPYDANEDCIISLDEANTAIDDYRTEQTDLETINEVIDLYRIGGSYCV
ncbi:TIGR04279 domain-containing protein [Methanococcoides sp. SA1]|nr:TIGR04279 domain-containing protein [Methanococcoides sp. SA1]